MTWIPSYSGLGAHPKRRRFSHAMLAQVERVSPEAAAIGHLQFLWWYAAEYAPDGDLNRLSDEEIAEACYWHGDPGAFMALLVQTGFVDANRHIHDWFDKGHAGWLVARRQRVAGWARARRQIGPSIVERDGLICQICGQPVDPQDLTLDHIYPQVRGGTHEPANLRVAHRSCNSKKGARA